MLRTAVIVDPDQLFPLCRGHSVLCNPYTHLPLSLTNAIYQVTTLEEAINCYTDWLDYGIRFDPIINTAMTDLYNRATTLYKAHRAIYLGCWCKDEVSPQKDDHECHCDYVRDRLIQKWLSE